MPNPQNARTLCKPRQNAAPMGRVGVRAAAPEGALIPHVECIVLMSAPRPQKGVLASNANILGNAQIARQNLTGQAHWVSGLLCAGMM